jgi:hypothetical protein
MISMDGSPATSDPRAALNPPAARLLVFGGARWLGMAGDCRDPGVDDGPGAPQILGSAHGPRILEILKGVAA